MVFSCLVVFATTYLLILPGFTLDKNEAAEQGGIDVPAANRVINDEEAVEAYETVNDNEIGNETDNKADADPDGGTEAAAGEQSNSSKKAEKVKGVKDLLTYEDDRKDYKVTASYGVEAGIPAGAELEVEEILPDENSDSKGARSNRASQEDPNDANDTDKTGASSEHSLDYEEYVAKTEDALGMEEGSAEYIRLFDIKIVDKNDHSIKYQPKEGTAVDVRIELADAEDGKDLSVVHFADDEAKGDVVENSTENADEGSAVEFAADGFSVYSIVNAPEPGAVYEPVGSIEDIEKEQAYYLSIVREGTNYMTSTSTLNSGTYELKGDTNRASGEKWMFEFPEEGKVYIYYLDSENNKKYLKRM